MAQNGSKNKKPDASSSESVDSKASSVPKVGKKKSGSDVTIAWIVAALLALVAIFYPQLQSVCPAFQENASFMASVSSIPAFLKSFLSGDSSSDPAGKSYPSFAEIARDGIKSFKNFVKYDYYPFDIGYGNFEIKRLISVSVYQHLRGLSPLSVDDLLLHLTSELNQREWRRGVVRIEALVAPADAPAAWVDAYKQRQKDLIVFNPTCDYLHAGTKVLSLTTGKFQVSFDLFHCDTTFLTLPADKVATVDCTRADGANSWTPFCFSQKEPGHIPGYISREQMENEEGDVNRVLDLSSLPIRQRPAEETLSDKHETEYELEECQDLKHDSFQRSIVEQVAHGPNFLELLPESNVQVMSIHPPLFVIDNYITDAENLHMKEMAAASIKPSEVIGSSAEEALQWRTSSSTFFANNQTQVMADLELRSRKVTGSSEIEGLQVVRYQQAQQYKYHMDWFQAQRGQGRALHRTGQRTHTLFVYLNDIPAGHGGETGFWHVMEMKVRPRKNSVALWFNVRPNGQEDELTLHAGLPIDNAEKWGMNIWLRDPRLVGPIIPCPA